MPCRVEKTFDDRQREVTIQTAIPVYRWMMESVYGVGNREPIITLMERHGQNRIEVELCAQIRIAGEDKVLDLCMQNTQIKSPFYTDALWLMGWWDKHKKQDELSEWHDPHIKELIWNPKQYIDYAIGCLSWSAKYDWPKGRQYVQGALNGYPMFKDKLSDYIQSRYVGISKAESDVARVKDTMLAFITDIQTKFQLI